MFSGIYTGSVYFDVMSQGLLLGSLVCPLYNTIIVKTHRRTEDIGHKCEGVRLANFTSAIYLVRNPYNIILAEFNRKNAGKVDVAPKEAFEGKGILPLNIIENEAKHRRSFGKNILYLNL